MSTLILAVIALWGIISYYKNIKSFFLISLVIVVSSGISLFPSSVMCEDLALMMAFAAIVYELSTRKHFFSVKGDPVGKLIVVLLFYYFVEVVVTTVHGTETFVNALKVYRRDLFYLYYFIFRGFNIFDIKKAYKPLLILTVIGGVLYYLQFLGIHILSNATEEMETVKGGYDRYGNIPMLGIPFMIYFIVRREPIKFLYLLFFLGFQIMPMSRGGIIAAVIVISYYIYKCRKYELYKGVVVKMMALVLLFSPVLVFRFVQDNERGSAVQDVKSASSLTDFAEFDYASGGTFTFRIAIALERILIIQKKY